MTRLTVALNAAHLDAIDRLMEGSAGHVPGRHGRRRAIPALLLACDCERLESARLERELRRLQDITAGVERARDEAAAQVAVAQSRLDTARQALREERRQHSVTRSQLNNALHTADRLRAARDRHRDFVRGIDAALRDPGRVDLGDSVESRVRRSLTDRGVSLPEPAVANSREK